MVFSSTFLTEKGASKNPNCSVCVMHSAMRLSPSPRGIAILNRERSRFLSCDPGASTLCWGSCPTVFEIGTADSAYAEPHQASLGHSLPAVPGGRFQPLRGLHPAGVWLRFFGALNMENQKLSLLAATPRAEHVIGYAFPGSSQATSLGHGSSGCFTIQVVGTVAPAATYGEAKEIVVRLGTTPGRWSWDHPLNTSFFSHHMHSDGQPLIGVNV